MEIKKAEIKDLDIVVKMKMEMFTEVGSVSFLQDDAEKKIYEKYKELYQNGKGCHYLIYEKDKVIACGGAVIKEDVPFCFFKTPMYGYIIDVYCVPEKRRNGYAWEIGLGIISLITVFNTFGSHFVRSIAAFSAIRSATFSFCVKRILSTLLL